MFTQGVKFVQPADLSGSLRGRQNLYNHLDMMVREAQKTITLVTTSDGLNRKLEALLPSLEKARKRGVKIRIAAPITPQNSKVAKDFSRIAEVRSSEDKMKARFMIIDGQQLLFMLMDDEKVHPNYDLGVWLNTDFFAPALEQLFEMAWTDMPSASKVVKK